jgi:hypothetical protein
MTPEQLATLRAAILAETDPEFVEYRTSGATGAMAGWFNEVASPAFVVFKRSVPVDDVGLTISYVALAAMTDANQGQLVRFTQLNPTSFDPSKADIRSFFNNTFGGALGGAGQATRNAMEALYRRDALRGEKLFATGTGSFAAPANLVFEGTVSNDDIVQAINLR